MPFSLRPLAHPPVAVSAIALLLGASLAACGSDEAESEAEAAPTTIDADALTVTPDEAQETLTTASTIVTATIPPEPFEAGEQARVASALTDFHAAVATSFDPVDPESAELIATTTPSYFETLQGLLNTLAESDRTVEPDFVADIIEVVRVDDDTARVNLCELDGTLFLDADGSAINTPTEEWKASFVVLLRDETDTWRVDGGGLDEDRTCP